MNNDHNKKSNSKFSFEEKMNILLKKNKTDLSSLNVVDKDLSSNVSEKKMYLFLEFQYLEYKYTKIFNNNK
jgi:hypothetical protein